MSEVAYTGRRRRRPTGGAAGVGRPPESYEGLDADDTMEDDSPLEMSRQPTDVVTAFERAAAERRARNNEPLDPDEEGGDQSPRDRLASVQLKNPEYAKEYRLRLIHRLLMRNLPLDQIAQQLGLSVKTVQRDRAEIYRMLKEEAAGLNANTLLADTIAFYKEHGSMALRIATDGKTPMPVKLAALRTSMQSRKEMGQWLHTAGVFEVIKFRANESGKNADISKLVRLAEEVLGDEPDLGELGTVDKATEQDEYLSLYT